MIFSFIGIIILLIIIIIIIIILVTRDKDNNKEDDEGIIKYIYFRDFYSEENKKYQYNSESYIDNQYIFNETGLYRICVYGASAIKGGRGGSVCGEYHFEENEILYYELGGREAGGERGKECGKRGDGFNGAGRAFANCSNGFIIVGGGGGGNSEDNNQGGDAGKDGAGFFGGKGGTIKEGGRKGNPDMNKTSDDYAKNGTLKKGGKGGRSDDVNYLCGGGGGDGFYGGGGGCFGEKLYDGGGGGGSNFHSDIIKTFKVGVNILENYAGIIITRIIK